jgi:CTP synthase
MQDCYKSILESFIHAEASNETKSKYNFNSFWYIDASNIEDKLKILMVY